MFKQTNIMLNCWIYYQTDVDKLFELIFLDQMCYFEKLNANQPNVLYVLNELFFFLLKLYFQTTRHLSERFYNELQRHNYVTPTSYLELISTFKVLLSKKQNEVHKLKRRYEVGLEKLNSAASQVRVLRHVFCASSCFFLFILTDCWKS